MYLSKVLKKHLLNFPMTVIDEDDIYQLKKNFCCRQLSVSIFFFKKEDSSCKCDSVCIVSDK